MTITSSDFGEMDPIPERFSRDGEDINPALTFSEIPEKTKSLALIVDDPDAPNGTFTHWILYNMSPATLEIPEGQLPLSGLQGINDYGETSYGGPQPPSGTHRYFFRLHALDTELDFEDGATVDRKAIQPAIDNHTIEKAEILGTYSAK